jgi:hypothetical protein
MGESKYAVGNRSSVMVGLGGLTCGPDGDAADSAIPVKRGTLEASRVERLAALPGWSWHPIEDEACEC